MPDDYTPTTRGVRQGYASGKLHRREMMPVAAKKAFDRWLVAHDAEKRTEWEAEQGETEWEDRTPWRGLRTGIRRSDTLAAKEAEAHVWSPRTRSEVLPVSDTASESREERSPAEGTAPHWSIVSADNIVIAQGYCWCNDPNGGYHQIGIKPAPVPDTTKVMIRCDYCGDDLPSVRNRTDIPTTPNLQRLGFDADKVVCVECADKALHPTNNKSEEQS